MSSPRQEVYLSYKPKHSTISSVTFRVPNTISFMQETIEHENKLKKWALSIFKGNARVEKNAHSLSSITTQLTFRDDEMRARFEKCLYGKDVRGAISVLDELPKPPAWRQEDAPEYKLKTFLSAFPVAPNFLFASALRIQA